MKSLFKGRKAMELSLQTVVTFIILIIVLIVLLYFFSTHYNENSNTVFQIGKSAIDTAKNS